MGQPHSWQRRWAPGETITYQVVRQGSTSQGAGPPRQPAGGGHPGRKLECAALCPGIPGYRHIYHHQETQGACRPGAIHLGYDHQPFLSLVILHANIRLRQWEWLLDVYPVRLVLVGFKLACEPASGTDFPDTAADCNSTSLASVGLVPVILRNLPALLGRQPGGYAQHPGMDRPV